MFFAALFQRLLNQKRMHSYLCTLVILVADVEEESGLFQLVTAKNFWSVGNGQKESIKFLGVSAAKLCNRA